MKKLLIRIHLLLFFPTLLGGCSGTGVEKRTTFVPDSISIGYCQEQYHHDPEAWKEFSATATWVFK